MKNLFLITLIFISVNSYSQFGDTLKWTTATGSVPYYSGNTKSIWDRPSYPEKDTLKCHFLEVENDSAFQWKSGYVIRHKGFIDFGKTSVQQEYLPITSGVVTSPLFYLDMSPIRNYAIQVTLKLIGRKETTVIGQ